MSKAYQSTFTGETNTPYSKQFVHSKSSQYRRLKTEWKNNVYLARSRIQGLGLYAAKDLEKHTMVIEYIGTVIRNEVANRREKIYEEQVTHARRPCVCLYTGTWLPLLFALGGNLTDAFIQSDLHTLTHRRQRQPCKATASSSGAVWVRCLAQGHIN